jgi:uncharacterized protein (UPF0332 family)
LKDERRALAEGRLATARERLAAAKTLLRNGFYKDAVARAYYAAYAAMRALLATKGLDSKSHQGVASLFTVHFVKSGLFPRDFTACVERARSRRERADYEELTLMGEADARREYAAAAKFVAAVEKYFKQSKSGGANAKGKANR